jgi:hypothetical protein
MTYFKALFSSLNYRLKTMMKAFLVSLLPQNVLRKIIQVISLFFRKKTSPSATVISDAHGSSKDKKKKTAGSTTKKTARL